MSVRNRFAVTVAAVVVVTVTLFATLSIVAIDRTMRSNFQASLRTAAEEVATTVDVHDGRISLDAGDLRHLAAVTEQTPFAVFDSGGRRIAGSAPPDAATPDVATVTAPVTRAGATFGSVLVWRGDRWIGDFDRYAVLVSLGAGLLVLALGIALSSRVARAALAPVERIASLAERIEGYDLSTRLHADGEDELGRLCASFDRMLDRLAETFDRERRFIADASHELRAPLSVLRAETELALRRPRSDAEYVAALHSLERETMRLEELVDQLLASARAGTDALEAQDFDLGYVAERVASRMAPAAALRGAAIRVTGGGWACANRTMIERALLAIVHNAIRFSPQGGAVRVSLAGGDGGLTVTVADDGAGFSGEALTYATERFWRGDPARSRGGTGLGLAIARTMVEANGGRLALANAPGGGAVVTMTLTSSSRHRGEVSSREIVV